MQAKTGNVLYWTAISLATLIILLAVVGLVMTGPKKDNMWMQMVPMLLLFLLNFIPAWRLFQKLEMSQGWAFWALVPLMGPMIMLWAAGFSRLAGAVAASLWFVGIIAAIAASHWA
jgi:hypothetical protein